MANAKFEEKMRRFRKTLRSQKVSPPRVMPCLLRSTMLCCGTTASSARCAAARRCRLLARLVPECALSPAASLQHRNFTS